MHRRSNLGDCGCKIHRGIEGWLAVAIVLLWLIAAWCGVRVWEAALHREGLFSIYSSGFFAVAFGVTAYLLTTKRKTGVQVILALLFLEGFVSVTHVLEGSYSVVTIAYMVASVLGMAYFARSARVKNTYFGEKIVTPCRHHEESKQSE